MKKENGKIIITKKNGKVDIKVESGYGFKPRDIEDLMPRLFKEVHKAKIEAARKEKYESAEFVKVSKDEEL